ncbi:hypothetical protein Pse7367_2634 [Thalassoporum mexicanum PCC 7367]|uniref:peptidylprolyl isomerase n=1 Tax=Thalassoporum mexicanum TaxID=3457544 RepID=UPI00029F96B5|nr:peptidylprolyl isomerase [Pseudanabaena sp. PCC 7367]AFY70890.1 hypothetical protein Pse7367_2634 [Pseudanabaena sp. PCC 7367]
MVDDIPIQAGELLPLLAKYRLLPKLKQELIIDQAIADIHLTAAQQEQAQQQFLAKYQISEPEAQQAYLNYYGLTGDQLVEIADREARIEIYKQQTWGHKLESIFLTQRSQLDIVTYSLIRTNSAEVVQELYFRIKDGEQSFTEVASTYSEGPEAQTGGLLGPTPLHNLHPSIAQHLLIAKPGQIQPPISIDKWYILLRLEQKQAAVLDDVMRQSLLGQLFQQWLEQQLRMQPSPD